MTCSGIHDTKSPAARDGVRRAAGIALLLLTAACGSTMPQRSIVDLTNPFLGPEHSSWLIGAVSRLATPEEVQSYLALREDQAAAAFIEAFWQQRDPRPSEPGNAFRETFQERATEADRLYSEAGYPGRRTARGELYVLYGPPSKVDFEVSPYPGGPPIELWIYDENAPSGLDGRRPSGFYRFVKQGDLTVPYTRAQPDRRPLDRRPLDPRRPGGG